MPFLVFQLFWGQGRARSRLITALPPKKFTTDLALFLGFQLFGGQVRGKEFGLLSFWGAISIWGLMKTRVILKIYSM